MARAHTSNSISRLFGDYIRVILGQYEGNGAFNETTSLGSGLRVSLRPPDADAFLLGASVA